MSTLTPEQAIEQLVRRLSAIAKKNDDKFSYQLDIQIVCQNIRYLFLCTETADGHHFVTGHGITIESAVTDATDGIEAACADWGYELP